MTYGIKINYNVFVKEDKKVTEEKKKTKSSSSSQTKSSKRGFSFSQVMDALSYVAVCIGGIALLLAFILAKVHVSAGVVSAMQKVANSIGWLVLCLLSVKFIKSKRKVWLWVVWAVAIVMIVVGVILA